MPNEETRTNTAVLDPPAAPLPDPVPPAPPAPAPAQAAPPAPPAAPDPAPAAAAPAPAPAAPAQAQTTDWPSASSWKWWHSAAILLIITALVFFGWKQKTEPKEMFLLTLALLTAFVMIAGHGTVGLWRGVLVDERNRMSLARLQLVLWTIVVLSGFLTAALWNIAKTPDSPLLIAVPDQLWMLLGISTTSLVASPLILSTKKQEPPPSTVTPEAESAKTQEANSTMNALAAQGLPPDKVATQGDVVVWKWPSDARIADLFQGDEIGNAGHLDLGKVQMLFFTVILVFAYTVALAHSFWKPVGVISTLPVLDPGMATLLAISHGGYLANKAVPHSVPTS